MRRAVPPTSRGGGDATRARPEITSANATGATFMGRGRAQPAQNAIPQGAWQPRTTLTTHTPARTRRRRPAPHRCRRATLTVTACPTPTRAHMLASIRCIALSLPPFHTHRTLSAPPVPTRTRRRADLLTPVRTLPAGPAPLLCARRYRRLPRAQGPALLLPLGAAPSHQHQDGGRHLSAAQPA